jgi:hypothetical protein
MLLKIPSCSKIPQGAKEFKEMGRSEYCKGPTLKSVAQTTHYPVRCCVTSELHSGRFETSTQDSYGYFMKSKTKHTRCLYVTNCDSLP